MALLAEKDMNLSTDCSKRSDGTVVVPATEIGLAFAGNLRFAVLNSIFRSLRSLSSIQPEFALVHRYHFLYDHVDHADGSCAERWLSAFESIRGFGGFVVG